MTSFVLEFEHIGEAAVRVAEELGIGGKFRYWCGRSGARYLFTRIDVDALTDFNEAVVLISERGEDPQALWVGQLREPGFSRWLQGQEAAEHFDFFVHLLAEDPVAKQAAISDLKASLAEGAVLQAA
ncbi:hypothetical protein [Polycladidibacter hongkongensis]|uniref:hypothetical protein n=1 Tax=Polycladidibacter hongkongensis TaxID=1647556 RepID=UPI00082CE8BB|nr:hypothetical protein [Pseudovibrio hongkongensis]